MPKARIVTKYEPEDALVFIKNTKFVVRCKVCKIVALPGEPMFWSPKEGKNYCPKCKELRVSDEGIATAMAERLLKG